VAETRVKKGGSESGMIGSQLGAVGSSMSLPCKEFVIFLGGVIKRKRIENITQSHPGKANFAYKRGKVVDTGKSGVL